ncbi:MAG: hypothetical protein NT133_18140 [Alphaproteobacteria bacterium]|nr:hypothetical protein [Alphaproteobacteria bacterium]
MPRRFVARFILILDALLVDLLGHMQAEAEALPHWHPRRLALRAVITAITRPRDAFAAMPEPGDAVEVLRAPETHAFACGIEHSSAPGWWRGGMVLPAVAPWGRCTSGAAGRAPLSAAI